MTIWWASLVVVACILIVARYRRTKEPNDVYMSEEWLKWYSGGAHSPYAIRKVIENGHR